MNDDDFVLTALYGARVLSSNNTWIIDSGATKHMSPFLDMFVVDYVPFRVNEPVSLGNGTNCEALGIGLIPVRVLCDGAPRRRILADVLYVPKLVNNFFSVTAATLKGFTVKFERERCVVFHDNTVIVVVNHLWYIDCLPHDVCANLNTSKLSKLTLWHQRLGHTNEQRLKFAVNKQLMIGVDDITKEVHLPFCEACVQSKQTRKPFRSLNDVQTKGKLQLIHSDVCGPGTDFCSITRR